MTAAELINAVREQVAAISQARGVTMAEALVQARVLVQVPDQPFGYATDTLSVTSVDDDGHGWSVSINAL